MVFRPSGRTAPLTTSPDVEQTFSNKPLIPKAIRRSNCFKRQYQEAPSEPTRKPRHHASFALKLTGQAAGLAYNAAKESGQYQEAIPYSGHRP